MTRALLVPLTGFLCGLTAGVLAGVAEMAGLISGDRTPWAVALAAALIWWVRPIFWVWK